MVETGEWAKKGGKMGDEEGVSQVLLKILGENLKGTGAEMTRGEERKRK